MHWNIGSVDSVKWIKVISIATKHKNTIQTFIDTIGSFAYSKYRFATSPTSSPIRSSFNGLSSPWRATTKSFSFGEWNTISWSFPGLTLRPSNCKSNKIRQVNWKLNQLRETIFPLKHLNVRFIWMVPHLRFIQSNPMFTYIFYFNRSRHVFELIFVAVQFVYGCFG